MAVDIDFKSTEFIFQNLDTLGIYDEQILDNEEIIGRIETLESISAQVCFYTMCALRAYQGVIKAPRILIYGPGVVGTHIINSLIYYGCGSMLRVYVRNNLHMSKWRDKGIKASDAVSKLLKAGTFEIVISTANAAGFSQFTKDLFGKISPKTCVISAVFGLQRTRIYQLLKTPCVFRTFIERVDVIQVKLEGQRIPSDLETENRATHGLSLRALKEGAILMATRIEDFKRQILMLENYFVLWGMTNEMAREQATMCTLGGASDSALPALPSDCGMFPDAIESKPSLDGGDSKELGSEVHGRERGVSADISVDTSAQGGHAAMGDAKSKGEYDDESAVITREDSNPLTPEQLKKRGRVPILDLTLKKLGTMVGAFFQKEFSKIARIGDLVEFSEFRWDVINNKRTAPRRLGDALAAQSSFENRNRGIVYVATFLTDIEIRALFRTDNEEPINYYYHSEILTELDATETLPLVK